ncbi:MAG: hypothetical protein CUN55_02485 [Phototrophicales bacterium]|nr:MAG: hypothetical protein CUN55_02485 [Phototrophicales bacterium]
MKSTEPTQKHRRDVWLQMVLPTIGVGLVITLIVVGLFTLAVAGTFSAEQIETMASVMMIVCVLAPLVLVMLGLHILMIVIAVGTGKIPAALRPTLRSARIRTEKAARTVSIMSTRLAQPFISIDTRWTRLEKTFVNLFNIPDTKPQSKDTKSNE